ncbi:MAG TPA: ABC transporter permease [Gaiellaceae bacterium]|nr:ABC transporter permease [Gaiellaceae bacterium]
MSGLRPVWLVTRREIREGIRGRQFLITTLVVVLILGGVVGIQSLVDGGKATTFAVGGAAPARLAPALRAAAERLDEKIAVRRYPTAAAARDALAHRKAEAAFVGGGRRLLVRGDTSGVASAIAEAAGRAVYLPDQAREAGITPAQARAVLASPLATAEVKAASGSGGQGFAFATTIVLFIAVSVYGQSVLMGVVQEKASRIVEVLLATLRPRHLLAGKVAGIGLLGLSQVVALAVFAVAAGAVGVVDLPSVGAAAPLTVLWFVLGFAFYATAFAAAGSLISRVEDAAVATPVTMVMLASYLLSFGQFSNPDGGLATALTLIPLSAPFTVPEWVALTSVPAWELAVSVALMLVAIWALVRFAGRVYELGLLRTGPRVPFREAFQAARRATA